MPDKKPRLRGDDPAISAFRVPRGMRKVKTRSETWYWRFGNPCLLRAADGSSREVRVSTLIGKSDDYVEMNYHDGNISVTPDDIIDYIDRHVRGYSDAVGFPIGSPWHREQADLRPGWIAFDGPRGKWQLKPSTWIHDILTPEGIMHQARAYHVLGMTIDEWADAKVADMKKAGTDLDTLRRAERLKPGGGKQSPEVLMGYDAPSIPQPTAAQLEAYVTVHIVGSDALRQARTTTKGEAA